VSDTRCPHGFPDPAWCGYCSPPPPGRDLPPDGDDVPDPDEWVTGDEPMTERQERYLRYLADQLGEQVPPDLTKAEASKLIAEWKERVDQLPMTEDQARRLEWLCRDAGEEMDWGLI